MKTIVLALALLPAGPALAAPPDPGVSVSAVVVPGGPPPRIAASYPADGATVPAGTLVLKIVFDQAMTPDNWSYGRTADAAFPNCLEHPRLLGDRRTFVLLCAVAAHRSYAIEINAPRDFANAGGRTAGPARLQFTTGDVGPRDLHAALTQAGLTDADDPIMTWKDPGGGVSSARRPDADAAPPG
jgi:hypothetical protein